jgi:hypothetical protein
MPFQEEGQFFNFQCIQSIEPMQPGNPESLPLSRRRFVSSIVGWQGAIEEKISFTALQKRFMD